uniref:Uncharacterized protein n=1 Tax=Rhizophora mucronata TaxID=61149 RepID=A0A2P2LJB7_RHIMU
MYSKVLKELYFSTPAPISFEEFKVGKPQIAIRIFFHHFNYWKVQTRQFI